MPKKSKKEPKTKEDTATSSKEKDQKTAEPTITAPSKEEDRKTAAFTTWSAEDVKQFLATLKALQQEIDGNTDDSFAISKLASLPDKVPLDLTEFLPVMAAVPELEETDSMEMKGAKSIVEAFLEFGLEAKAFWDAHTKTDAK